MSGIWIRSEDGNLLTVTNQLWIEYEHKSWTVVAADINAREGESSRIALACFDSEESAIRQLDDIQTWMRGGVAGITDSGVINVNVYDLRERKVQEQEKAEKSKEDGQ